VRWKKLLETSLPGPSKLLLWGLLIGLQPVSVANSTPENFAAGPLGSSFAAEGRGASQFLLASLYLKGGGLPKNPTAAAEWYRKAANQGHREASYVLGLMYEQGLGVPLDMTQAIEWYRRAAEQGHAGAQITIGLQYFAGNAVDQNDAIGGRWIYRAAAQGSTDAQLLLADMLASGKGVPENHVGAYAWATFAEGRLTDEKLKRLSETLRETIGRSLSPEQIGEAQMVAGNWAPSLETPAQMRWDIIREQDGILASLTVAGGEAKISWRFIRPVTAPLIEINGTVDGKTLGLPRLAPYPQPNTNTSVLFLLDVTDPSRQAQFDQDKSTLAEIAAQAQPHHQIDAAVYGDQLELLAPGQANMESLLDLARTAQLRTGNANLGQALLTGINVPSSAPADRRAIFVLTDGHSDDTLNTSILVENAKRTTTSLNFIVSPSERSVNLSALEQLAADTGGLVVKQDQLAALLESPFQLVDSGATVRFPLAHLRRNSQTDPKVTIALKYGTSVLELISTAGNDARLERVALTHVLESCDASCTEDFRKQVQDRIDLITAEEKTYEAAQDDPKRLRDYVAHCVACNFREEADVRATALDEIAAQAAEESGTRSKREELPVSKKKHRHR
jgi:hypothetical protein